MTYFPPTNAPLPTPAERAPYDLYLEAHKNFVIGYNDVVLHNPETDEFFFPTRAYEPEQGSTWVIGGRTDVGDTGQESVSKHVEHDTHLDLDPSRFYEVSHWAISHVTPQEGGDPKVRHAANTVYVADLKPDEVDQLNKVVAEGGLSKEYSDGKWFNVHDTKDLPDPLKQFARDFFSRQVMMDAIHDAASEEHVQRYGTPPKTTA